MTRATGRTRTRPWPPQPPQQRRDVKEYTFLWEGVDRNNRQVRGEMRGGVRDGRHDQPAPPGHPRHQDQAADVPRRPHGQREGHHVLHAPARDDAEGRRAAAAVVRHRRARPQQRALLAADDGHQEPDRDRARACRRRSASTRRTSTRSTATWSRAGETSGMLDAILDRLATYKEKILAIKSKIKSRAVLPDLGDRRRDRRRLGDHGLRDPGVQAGVHELRRRPAGAHADRDRRSPTSSSPGGGSMFLDRRRRDRRRSRAATSAPTAFRYAFDRLLLKFPVIGDDPREGDDRALDAHARRRCSPPACRWSSRSTPSAARRATSSTPRRPSGSRPRSAPARASPTR